MKRYWHFTIWVYNKIQFRKLFYGASVLVSYIGTMTGWIFGMISAEHRTMFWTIGGVSTLFLVFLVFIWPSIRKQWRKYNEEADQIFNTLRGNNGN